MKMNDEMEKAFNAQIDLELSSSMVYRQLAIEMDLQDLPGIASWLRVQADEEMVHANKLIEHMCDRDNRASIGAIDKPSVVPGSTVIDVFAAAVSHEEKVSKSIRELYRAGERNGDLDSRPLLNWFLAEQVSEESQAGEILARARLVDGDGPGLLRLDAELAQRPAQDTGA